MKPDYSQLDIETLSSSKPDSTTANTDQNSALKPVSQSMSSTPEYPKKRGQKLYIFGLIIIILILLVGFFVWKINSNHADQQASESSKSEGKSISGKQQFFGNSIPQVDCSDVMDLAKDKKLLENSKPKYQCYKSIISVDNEKLNYVVIQLAPDFQKEWQDKCTLDCGSSPSDYPAEGINQGTFIVRTNGKVESYIGFGGGGLESMLTDLTGCGTYSTFGILDKLNDGSLVIDNNMLGSLSKFSGLNVTDNFGNICTVDLELISYLTASTDEWYLTDSVSIKKASVHYELKEIASCSTDSALSYRQACYIAQAVLRNDIAICENLASSSLHPTINPGFDNCVMAVAKRNRDPKTCDKIRYYREQFLSQCQKDANAYKAVLKNDMIIK